MKQLLKTVLLLLALLLPAIATAHDFEVDGIYYNKNGSKATVTYRGPSYTDYLDRYVGNVTIPSAVTYGGVTYNVTHIGSYAFKGCTGLTSVTIPNSVTSIGDDAFYGCTGLSSVNIGSSVTSINGYAFYGCSSLTSINFVSSIKSIGNCAFYGCTGLTSINIPSSVTSIGNRAFQDCNGLTTIAVSSGNTKYDSRNNCNAIIETTSNTLIAGCKNTVIPVTVTAIGGYAFFGCSGLTSMSIPNSVTSIGSYAFRSCSNLMNLTIPSTITSISSSAFEYCKLTDVNCYIVNPSSVIIGDDVFYYSSLYSNRTLHVPAGSLALYQNSSAWEPYFGTIVEMESEAEILASSISLNMSSANLFTGETIQLTATILPTNATNKAVNWTSSNSSIATVSSNGIVTAKAPGTAIITASTTDGSNLSAFCIISVINQNDNLTTGEWATLDDGTPAMIGQTTADHLFVRGDYTDQGNNQTYDNIVSFKSGATQLVWLWLDDDQIYLNEKVQALPPIPYNKAGDLYNEITYCSFQCNLYLPQGIEMVSVENEEGEEAFYVQGDRLPSTIIFKSGKDEVTKVIDGITYDVYTLIVSNMEEYGIHFSAKNGSKYKANGALKKDDAPLIGLYLRNNNQSITEGRLADIIIANMEFGLREPFTVEPNWEPNEYRFIHGTGGNNETQRYQLYNRVALYGSAGLSQNILANSISLSNSSAELSVGENMQLTATVLPYNTTNKTVTWKSSNVNVATVDNYGNVTAISAGSAIITATTTDGSNLSASCYVTVNEGIVLATSIALNTNSLVLGINGSSQLTATIYPSNTTNKTVNWYSSNPSVATVNSDGLVTALAEGSATIIATTTDGSNLFASCSVSVYVQATSITLSSSFMTLNVNDVTQLTATITPSNASYQSLTWTSSNPSVATVNSDGIVTTHTPGTATITAITTDGSNLSASCYVVVVQLASSISLNQTNLSLTVNQTAQLNATVYPSNSSNNTVTWNSSNTSVATVSSSGLVTAKSTGSATITATTTDGTNLSASCQVTVSSVPVTSISLNSSGIILDLGDQQTEQLVPTILPSNATNQTVSWSSSNPAIAIVTNNGLVIPISQGNATITATTTDGTNLSASCIVYVVKRVKGISLNESNLTLTLPETAQLTATITPSDATNRVLNWTSSNTSVATVNSNGFVTSVGVGTTTIKATTTDGTNLSATCQVTVVKQYVTSITLNESNLVMHSGETAQLIANVLPDNASNKTLTWTSGNTSVATVDNNGLVTANAPGTATIIASTTDGSYLSAICMIEVLPDYYLTLDTLSHIRGTAAQVVDLPVTLVNKNLISGIQFDVTLPTGVEFYIVDDMPDVWLDEARATRSHSVTASQLSDGKYRVLVTSSSSKDLKGHDGELVHMNLLLPHVHDSGNPYITITNIIASESDETRHTLDNTSTVVHFYYIVGDADANALVDIADHAATASKILGKSPSPFYYDAANVDANYSLDVVDLVGITNIALEIKPITIRQAPVRGSIENRLYCDKLNINAGEEKVITVGMDCGFAFAGFQMDLTLPHGLTLADATLGDVASSLSLATAMMPDGTIRILGTSFSDAIVDGVCPELLTLKVKAENEFTSSSQIEFSSILFAERDLASHTLDDLSVVYVEPSVVYEIRDDIRIYVENGDIIVETPVDGTVQLIAVDGRMTERQAQVGRNVYAVDASGIFIIHFKNKTIKVKL